MSDLDSIKAMIRYFIGKQKRYPRLFFGMLATHPFAILFLRFLPALIIADILNKLTNQDFVKGDLWGSFGWLIVLAIGIEALGGIFIWRIVIYFNWKMEGYIIRDIYREVFDHLLKLSSNFHANHFGGSLVSQTSKLASAYVRFTDTTLFQVLGLFWALIFASVLLVGRAPLFVLLLIAFTIVYMIMAVAITGKIRRLNEAEAEASNNQTGQLADAITNVMAIKSFSASKAEARRFAKTSEKARLAIVDVMKATLNREIAFASVGATINGISVVLAIASVVIFDANIATVFLILNYTTDILVRLWEFSTQALRNYNRAIGDSKSMIDILAIEPSIKDPAKPQKSRISKGSITFRNMQFAHAGSNQDDPLFSDLNLSIKASEKIGLVGHSGSGKTTLTRLLLRFSDVSGGEILIDSQNIANISQDDLRKAIAYVPQEPLLFHRSIRENIAYGKPGASDKEITEAARKAHAMEFIEKMPEGLDTLVGERGVKLSGGQRQRIAIARALLKDAPILVLDEATSALDSESEKLIQAALWELMKNRTAIVIAHRLSTIQKMDRILVLEDGAIVEQGNHQELVKQQGVYAQLWAHQSGGFIED
ncbi:MAG TPA: ABC transporter ATP-binding protein [Candidatus Saccharimonadales bacterium]|nr:ABC transporter ATP-binding protein [Candidatus Saccharimonadales bacterium]